MATDLILVHSGSQFPFHINDCIALAHREGFRVHLILETKFHHLILSPDVILIDLDSITDERYATYSINNYDTSFRDGFFPRTSSRFILIDNYARKEKLYSFWHIENDIATLSNLQNSTDILEKSQYDTAIVLDHSFRCVPSIIWYRNTIASNRIANFVYTNNNLDDMRNLALYFQKHRDVVTNLPIITFDLVDPQLNINFGNMHQDFAGVFDGAAIGQYLYGIDILDSTQPNNTKGFINETCVVNFSQFNIHLINKKLFIHYNNQFVPIYNAHIHSKNFAEIL